MIHILHIWLSKYNIIFFIFFLFDLVNASSSSLYRLNQIERGLAKLLKFAASGAGESRNLDGAAFAAEIKAITGGIPDGATFNGFTEATFKEVILSLNSKLCASSDLWKLRGPGFEQDQRPNQPSADCAASSVAKKETGKNAFFLLMLFSWLRSIL